MCNILLEAIYCIDAEQLILSVLSDISISVSILYCSWDIIIVLYGGYCHYIIYMMNHNTVDCFVAKVCQWIRQSIVLIQGLALL